MVWQAAGICRIEEDMQVSLEQIQTWQQSLNELQNKERLWIETRNLADFAYLLVRSALFRTESRGAHYRIDYPNTLPEWQAHTVIHNSEIYREALERSNN